VSTVENIREFKKDIPNEVEIVAVSKTKPISEIQAVFDSGHKVFGENKIQELVSKHEALPNEIKWHMIGHLQTNKVKYIAPFISLIHAVDSIKLLKEINKQAERNELVINCLFQIKIATEESKFGLDRDQAMNLLQSEEYAQLRHVKVCGLMGMATFTDDQSTIRSEFRMISDFMNELKATFFSGDPNFRILSLGMTNDFRIAIEEGSNLIRIGSAIFGPRG